MKNKVFRIVKKAVAGIALGAMTLSGVFFIPVETQAAGTSECVADEVHFAAYDYEDFAKYVTKSAPEYQGNRNTAYGYVFGGWFKGENETEPVTSLADANGLEKVYAKFVPAYVMGVKCQNHLTTSEDGTMKIRIISSIDSARYNQVGMIVNKVTLDVDKNFVSCKKVYEGSVNAYKGKLNVYTSATQYTQYSPDAVFGTAARYFTAANLSGISDYDMIISVQPYWVTKDGVTVTGLGRYVRVNDGAEGYVSIPVNLNNEADVAAGVLSVDFSSMAEDGYELASVECGTVFTEVDSRVSENVVKCVGNVTELDNAKSDDIFVNLRFKVPTGATSRLYSNDAFYHLTVSEEEFTNLNEDSLVYDVWNIQY